MAKRLLRTSRDAITFAGRHVIPPVISVGFFPKPLNSAFMARKILVAAQVAATLLFVLHYRANTSGNWMAWVTPLAILILIVINSVWFSRFGSWLIFSLAFFSLLVILSAFTLRWRLEPEFSARPFYRSLGMYTLFIYISLGQIKILGGANAAQK